MSSALTFSSFLNPRPSPSNFPLLPAQTMSVISTAVTELFKIRHPILLAGMSSRMALGQCGILGTDADTHSQE